MRGHCLGASRRMEEYTHEAVGPPLSSFVPLSERPSPLLADLETTPLIDANPLENNETGRP